MQMTMRWTRRKEERKKTSRGFSLVEAIVAVSILVVAVLSIVQLFLYTARSAAIARRLTMGSVMAGDKMEQLRSLAWSYDIVGAPITDIQTDLTGSPERPSGGVGLRTSPSDVLDRNVAGYCDFLDSRGRLLGGGEATPGDAVFVRRWSVTPLPASADALVIQVRTLSREASNRGGTDAGDVTLTTVRARSVR